MQEFNNYLAALLPTLNLSVTQDTSQEPGKSLINVTELARSRYSYQVPVFMIKLPGVFPLIRIATNCKSD